MEIAYGALNDITKYILILWGVGIIPSSFNIGHKGLITSFFSNKVSW